ncbi:MAG: carbon monoxide dehydrogenase subunit G, partial [Caldilineaceae bacterium]|nr:carbon monoxide dehydrogenase subunit G [Caldilineaceae bacterium]
MQLEGSYQFQAPRAAVWDALMNPDVLAQALPGGEQMERVGDNEYRAVMNVRVGPVQGKFQGSIELADIVEQESYRMTVSGQGAPGFLSGEGTLRLEENGTGTDAIYTDLIYSGDVQIGGRIAGVSQRLIDSTAKSLTRQGL